MLLEPIFGGGRKIIVDDPYGKYGKLFLDKFDYIMVSISIIDFLIYNEVLIKIVTQDDSLYQYRFNPKFVGENTEYIGSIEVKKELSEIKRKINLILLGI